MGKGKNKGSGCAGKVLGVLLIVIAIFVAVAMATAPKATAAEMTATQVWRNARLDITRTALAIAATWTETPVPTVDHNEAIAEIVAGAIGGRQHVISILLNPSAIVATYDWISLATYDVDFAENNILKATCRLRDAGYTGLNYRFVAMVGTIDQFGNEGTDEGMIVTLLPEIIDQINCDDEGFGANLQAISESYFLRADIAR